ncbi:MAG TPA: enolase C-terminal domain-like protein [Stellaceae bacterium]|jgi:L-alanine-DL-glutamate epimerase-like enolase superfamily enzyme|nr:enolase C-terminal domain-like protein [Stellaceae bacterium]
MRIVDIRERSVAISRYADPAIPAGGLTTSIVALTTDVMRDGRPVVGYGFASIGRFAQSGLIRERFAPRLLEAGDAIAGDDGRNLDPLRGWAAMMRGEKPGGHGERCVAVGTLDMALWDAAAKIAEKPLYRYLADRIDRAPLQDVPVYAGGGYPYPGDDVALLSNEIRRLRDLGFTRVKIKIGAAPLAQDLRRMDAASRLLQADHLAVDAMNSYDAAGALAAARALAPHKLWWFEDICDPLDFDTLAAVAAAYDGKIAAGEALFSAEEARLLDRHGGLRRERDILLFDPVHCYGIPGYLRIVESLTASGWKRSAFWPHGGHLFCLHLVSALGLGGAEVNPLCFAPFGGLADATMPVGDRAAPPQDPGIGFEGKADLHALFETLLNA